MHYFLDPCMKNPCQNIARAFEDSCVAIGETDFLCDCQTSYVWDNDTNSCGESEF